MSSLFNLILHQAFFGGVAAAGFGVLFNAPPRLLAFCFGSGAMALTVRTLAQGYEMSLPAASFFAALSLALIDRSWMKPHSSTTSVIAVVGCIAMIPGSLAAKVLMGFISLLHVAPEKSTVSLDTTLENLIVVTFTLIAIGIGLSLPILVYPQRMERGSHLF